MSRRSTLRLTVLSLLLALMALPSAAAPEPEPLWTAGRLPKVLAAYHQALPGKLRVLDLRIYSNYVRMQVQDPAKRENVDQYDYRGGVSDPVPVKLAGKGDLEANLFSFDEVALDRIPTLVEEAAARLPMEGATMSYVLVRRGLPFSKDVQITIFMSGTRKSGVLKADAKGKVIEARVH